MSKKLIKCKACGEEIAKDAKVCPHCGSKNKKPLVALRIIVGILLVFIGIGVLSQVFSSGRSSSDSVTKEEFDSLSTGMSYAQVVDIIGFDGELGSQLDLGMGDEFKTEIYTWSNSNGSNMNATFQGGKLTMKAQAGLK